MRLLLIVVSAIYLSNQKVFFSTKTSYEHVADYSTTPLISSSYQIVYLRYVGRHGSRYPGPNDRKAMLSTIYFLFKNSPNYNRYFGGGTAFFRIGKAHSLAPAGVRQLYELGKRYRVRLGSVTNSPNFSPENFRFESTCKARSIKSMIAFVNGFLPMYESTRHLPYFQTLACNQDFTYRFFDFCHYYTALHRCEKQVLKQQTAFMNTPTMEQFARTISRRLILPKSKFLSTHAVLSLYLLCSYNISLAGASVSQGVCSLFDERALIALDYLLDIKNYYKRGEYVPINTQVACPLFGKVYDSVIDALNSCSRHCTPNQPVCDAVPAGEFGFAHAETLLPLLTSFGFFSPSGRNKNPSKNSTADFMAENFHNISQNRTFLAGFYSPMAGHIMFLVACPKDGLDEGVVMAVLNEKPIPIPCCDGTYIDNNSSYPVCKKSQFVACFKEKANNCDFLKTCSQEYECKNNET